MHISDITNCAEDTRCYFKTIQSFKKSYHEIQVLLPVPARCHTTEKEKQFSLMEK